MLTRVNFSVNQLIASDMILGYHVSNWNSKINFFLIGSYRSVNLFNAHYIYTTLKKFMLIVSDMSFKKCRFWFVNEDSPLFDLSTNMQKLKKAFPEVVVFNKRWLKGTLSNYKKVAILKFRKFPHAVVVPNLNNNHYVINETFLINVPSFCLIDSSDNPSNVYFPIPGNSKSVKSLFFLYYLLCKSVLKSRILRTSSFLFNFYQKSKTCYNLRKFFNSFINSHRSFVPRPYLFSQVFFFGNLRNYGWLPLLKKFKKVSHQGFISVNTLFYVYSIYFVNLLKKNFLKKVKKNSTSFFSQRNLLLRQILKTIL